MEIMTKQFKILEVFTRFPWKGLTFKQIKELSKNKSDNYVHSSLKKFVQNKILRQEKIGNNILYFIGNNINSMNSFGFIAEYKANSLSHIPHENIQKIINKIKTAYYSFIITGSYAKNQQKKSSDLDVVVICDNKQKPQAILAEIKLESELMIPEIHPYVFKEEEFYEMLVNDEQNYGKETAKNNLIIAGGREYFTILLRAVKNGFNG